LPAGEEAKALITLEVARRAISPPADTDVFVRPRKLARDVKEHLSESPYIESRHAKIRALAKEAAVEKPSAWQQVETLYDLARAKVQYKFGPLKGGLKALEEGEGDCEDISSLFIALCRASEIPARTVWVPGHCYPEFYLEDQAGRGYWFPCQAAGDRDFGGIPELRPILQKGDNFRVPQQREPQRYVSENLRAADAKGAPSVRFVREIMPR
jgi:transglutaminase-like putative cysteine protease